MITLVLLSVGPSGSAQEQERKLLERLDKPNMELKNSFQDKAFGGGKSYGARNAHVKEFYVPERYAPKSFQTRSFAAKSHHAGDLKYATGEASTKGRYSIPNATKKAETKTLAVKDAREAGKTVETREMETSASQMRGKSQALLDAENSGRAPMTIDQVRELLNKNK